MSRTTLSIVARRAALQSEARLSLSTATRSSLTRQFMPSSIRTASRCAPYASHRSFATTPMYLKGLSPETENPQPKEAETNATASAPADLSAQEYNDFADEYLNALVEKLEALQEKSEEVDCEYSAGVLTLAFPPNGTYVINKQPPNKQIWLSSPLSGPKRYDFVLLSEGQDAKEGTGAGDWVYLRDGSTLSQLLLNEIKVDMSAVSGNVAA